MDKKVRIYTTNFCAYCKKAKEWMMRNSINFEEVNVEDDPVLQAELVEKSGQYGVPVIEVGGRMMIGWNESRFREMIEE